MQPWSRPLITAVLVVGVLLTACANDPRDLAPPDTVATVNGHIIDRLATLQALTWLAVARNADPAARLKLAEKMLDQLIEKEVLVQAAQAAEIKVTREDIDRALVRAAAGYPTGAFERMLHAEQMTAETYKQRLERELLVERYLTQQTSNVRDVSEAELRALFKAKVLNQARPSQVRSRQVLVKTEEEADHILGELNARRLTVEKAAKRYSVAPEGAQGGLLPWFTRGELPQVFDHCFSLKPGEISDVIPSNYGFHIFQTVAQRPAGPPSFESVRIRLERDLRRDKEKRAIEALVKQLKGAANITIDQAALRHVVQRLPPPPLDEGSGPDRVPAQQNEDSDAPFQVKNKPVPRYPARTPSTAGATP